jgi:hypothetical protein
MRVSDTWRRQHVSGDVAEDAREALRQANARRDRRWRAVGRNAVEMLGAIAALMLVLTALGLFGKLLVLAWGWILS